MQGAFDDVIKAREDEERVKNEAQSYANGIVPEARGRAQRMMEESNAYRDQVIARADGEAQRFSQLLAEYEKAPEVTRERLYIDAIEEVYGRSNKVFLDSSGSGNLLYLPVDQLMRQGVRQAPIDVNRSSDSPTPQQQRTDIRVEPVDPRERRTRDE